MQILAFFLFVEFLWITTKNVYLYWGANTCEWSVNQVHLISSTCLLLTLLIPMEAGGVYLVFTWQYMVEIIIHRLVFTSLLWFPADPESHRSAQQHPGHETHWSLAANKHKNPIIAMWFYASPNQPNWSLLIKFMYNLYCLCNNTGLRQRWNLF